METVLYTLDQIKEAVDQMIREDDYSPDEAQNRIEQILTRFKGDSTTNQLHSDNFAGSLLY